MPYVVPPSAKTDHQDRDHPPLPAPQPCHQPADPGLDGAGPHGHAEEAADDDDEQRHVDRAEQGAGVVVVDVPLGVLDAVEAVDRRGQRVDQDPRGVRRRPRGRCPGSGSRPCRARRRRRGRSRSRSPSATIRREQDRVRRRQREPRASARLGRRRGRVSHETLLRCTAGDRVAVARVVAPRASRLEAP